MKPDLFEKYNTRSGLQMLLSYQRKTENKGCVSTIVTWMKITQKIVNPCPELIKSLMQ